MHMTLGGKREIFSFSRGPSNCTNLQETKPRITKPPSNPTPDKKRVNKRQPRVKNRRSKKKEATSSTASCPTPDPKKKHIADDNSGADTKEEPRTEGENNIKDDVPWV